MWVNEKLCSEAGQYRLCRRPDEGRGPTAPLLQIFRQWRCCTNLHPFGPRQPGPRPAAGVTSGAAGAAPTSHDPADRQIRWIGFSRRRLEAARPG